MLKFFVNRVFRFVKRRCCLSFHGLSLNIQKILCYHVLQLYVLMSDLVKILEILVFLI